MKSIVGYDFSMGLMAVGVREQESDASALFNPAFRRLVCLPECVKPDNLGTVFRSSAALGMDGIILSTRSCDPLSRRARTPDPVSKGQQNCGEGCVQH